MPSETLKRRIKFKADIPLRLEYALVNRFGFQYFARKKNEWVIYERTINPGHVDFSDLADDIVTDLTRRVNRIVSSFENPEEHLPQIKTRCTNLARTLTPKQRAWVLDWIRRVIDEEEDHPQDDDPPWEDDSNFEFCGGFC
jgi:hypothetical protein